MNNYRPISLLPILSKVFEGFLKKKLSGHLEHHDFLAPSQFGFRPQRSTSDAILSLVNYSLEALEQGLECCATFVDLSKAFDRVCHRKLVQKLSNFEFSSLAISMIESFLSDRFQVVQFREQLSQLSQVRYGVPQGSILGPVLFTMYVNDLPSCVSDNTHTVQYADDTTFSMHGQSLDDLRSLSDGNVGILRNWCTANNLVLNEEKTVSFH